MDFFRSTIGKKYIMGITGVVWSLFVMQHMVGNFLIFLGAESYNSYSHAITSNPVLMYGGEAVLLGSLLLHIITAICITRENKAARPQAYAMTANGEKGVSLASKTMLQTGLLTLAFLIYHLITFKYGNIYMATYSGIEMRDIHRLVMEVYQDPAYVLGYIFCLMILGVHLSHGVSSMFRSWGFNHPKYTPMLEKLAIAYGVIVALGFISQPIYVMFQG